MTTASHFCYINGLNLNNLEDTLVAVLPSAIKTKRNLLSSLSISLKFPQYFGYNWDALFDCLREFSWIKEHSISLFHSDIPNLQDIDLKIYLSLLYDSILHWNSREEHNFKVFFRKSDREVIENLLKK